MLEKFDFKGYTIRMEKRTNGEIWASLTDIAKASNKLVGHWLELKSVKLFLPAFAESIGKTIDQIILLNTSEGSNNERGTWAIQEVSLKFAGWCSVDFEIWMLDKIKTLLNEGTVSLRPKTALELAREQVLLLEDLERKKELIAQQEKDIAMQRLFLQVKEEVIQKQDEVLTEQNMKLEEQEPKVEFYEVFREVETNVTAEIFAKTVSNKLGGRFPVIGRNNLFKILRKYSFLRSAKHNPPYQRYVNSGLFTVIQKVNPNLNQTYTQTLITPKGQQELLNWFLKKYQTPDYLRRDLR